MKCRFCDKEIENNAIYCKFCKNILECFNCRNEIFFPKGYICNSCKSRIRCSYCNKPLILNDSDCCHCNKPVINEIDYYKNIYNESNFRVFVLAYLANIDSDFSDLKYKYIIKHSAPKKNISKIINLVKLNYIKFNNLNEHWTLVKNNDDFFDLCLGVVMLDHDITPAEIIILKIIADKLGVQTKLNMFKETINYKKEFVEKSKLLNSLLTLEYDRNFIKDYLDFISDDQYFIKKCVDLLNKIFIFRNNYINEIRQFDKMSSIEKKMLGNEFNIGDEEHLQNLRCVNDYIYLFFDIISRRKKRIGIIGHFNSGKSTFINGILGAKNLLPTKNEPATSIITILRWSEKDYCEYIDKDDNIKTIDLKSNEKEQPFYYGENIKEIIINKNHKFLMDKTVIDMPGFNSTNIVHKKICGNFIKNHEYYDLIIFLISCKPNEQSEISNLKIFGNLKNRILPIFNFKDLTQRDELINEMSKILQDLNITERIYELNALSLEQNLNGNCSTQQKIELLEKKYVIENKIKENTADIDKVLSEKCNKSVDEIAKMRGSIKRKFLSQYPDFILKMDENDKFNNEVIELKNQIITIDGFLNLEKRIQDIISEDFSLKKIENIGILLKSFVEYLKVFQIYYRKNPKKLDLKIHKEGEKKLDKLIDDFKDLVIEFRRK